eukprot:scaffold676808_cov50-Prasinocladus_malaysianus.AAC.1
MAGIDGRLAYGASTPLTSSIRDDPWGLVLWADALSSRVAGSDSEHYLNLTVGVATSPVFAAERPEWFALAASAGMKHVLEVSPDSPTCRDC